MHWDYSGNIFLQQSSTPYIIPRQTLGLIQRKEDFKENNLLITLTREREGQRKKETFELKEIVAVYVKNTFYTRLSSFRTLLGDRAKLAQSLGTTLVHLNHYHHHTTTISTVSEGFEFSTLLTYYYFLDVLHKLKQ